MARTNEAERRAASSSLSADSSSLSASSAPSPHALPLRATAAAARALSTANFGSDIWPFSSSWSALRSIARRPSFVLGSRSAPACPASVFQSSGAKNARTRRGDDDRSARGMVLYGARALLRWYHPLWNFLCSGATLPGRGSMTTASTPFRLRSSKLSSPRPPATSRTVPHSAGGRRVFRGVRGGLSAAAARAASELGDPGVAAACARVASACAAASSSHLLKTPALPRLAGRERLPPSPPSAAPSERFRRVGGRCDPARSAGWA
mmetsp:Transcript_2291/g.9134  ORF Transcript_2291/g.9134 Transcript_2291/m.9134 type:complete len:265 (+) Transcript_2291:262-1056(+)